jgi:5'(3')-deoxyribonucleotidase
MKKVIAIDMDCVLADFLKAWVSCINLHDDPNLKIDDILGWNVKEFVNTDNDVYRHLDYHFFRNLEPIKGSQLAVRKLMERYEVFIVTTATTHPRSLTAKLEWLTEYFPFIPHSHVVLCGDKSIIRADFMIDDGVHNLETFKGTAVLFDAPHNREETKFIRMKDWKDSYTWFNML